MILISVKSEVMDAKRQFEKDIDAERYLKRVKRLHDLSRILSIKKENKNLITSARSKSLIRTMQKHFRSLLKNRIPLRVEIINTNANQLKLNLKSK